MLGGGWFRLVYCGLVVWVCGSAFVCLVMILLVGCSGERCLCVYFSRLFGFVYCCWIGSLVWLDLLFCCGAFFAGF